jgi:hypothetical protein
MGPLLDDSRPDTVVHFGNEESEVHWHWLVCSCCSIRHFSSQFQFPLHSPTADISIASDVSRESVVELLKACDQEEFSVWSSIAHDLIVSSEEFDVETLRNRVSERISSNETNMIVSTLQFEMKHEIYTILSESRLRANSEWFVNCSELFDLPLSILCRVINICDIHSRFEFIMKYVDKYGPPASILFSGLDISKLRLEEVHRLEGDSRIIWSLVGSSTDQFIVMLQGVQPTP